MVQYKTIIKAIEEYLKCYDYPKAIALQNFNRDDYQKEVYGKYIFDPGEIQSRQMDLQKSVDYTGTDKMVVGLYNIRAFSCLQKYLNNVPFTEEDGASLLDNGKLGVSGGYPSTKLVEIDGKMVEKYKFQWEELSMGEFADNLHNVCEKSPPLQQNTVLYRYGRIPSDVLEGGHGTFKGFTGTCFGEEQLNSNFDQFTQWADPKTRYKLTIYAPKGTKGVTLTHECGAENPYQNEFLIDKGQKFIVLSRNDETKEAEILLY